MGKHRRVPRVAHVAMPMQPPRTVEVVDTAGTAHLLTVDAMETGLLRGRYTTLCAEEIQPAALVAKMARYCRLCVPIPVPRSR